MGIELTKAGKPRTKRRSVILLASANLLLPVAHARAVGGGENELFRSQFSGSFAGAGIPHAISAALATSTELQTRDPSVRAPALAGGSYSGFRPTCPLADATDLPVMLHNYFGRDRMLLASAAALAASPAPSASFCC